VNSSSPWRTTNDPLAAALQECQVPENQVAMVDRIAGVPVGLALRGEIQQVLGKSAGFVVIACGQGGPPRGAKPEPCTVRGGRLVPEDLKHPHRRGPGVRRTVQPVPCS